MSAQPFTDRRDERFFRDSDTSRSASRRRAEEAGAWNQDLETSVYGEQAWTMPGKGDPGKDCGVWAPRKFCEKGHVEMGPHKCGNRACPDCWSTWARDLSVSGTARMAAARHAAEQGEKRTIHGAVSPEQGTVTTIEEVYEMWKEAYGLSQQKGVRGGACILHLYRIKDDVKDLIEMEREREEFQGGDWKWVREHERHWRDLTYWSPHVHVIGWVGSNDVGAGDDEADDGWVWRNIRSLEPLRLSQQDGFDDMAGLMMYLLSHTGFEKAESKQTVRWFGELSTASFSPEEALSPGAWDTIKRRAEAAIGGQYDEEANPGAEDDEDETCSHDGCEEHSHDIWDARDFLEQRGDRLDEEAHNRVLTAYMWATGDIDPPPGLKNPRNEQHCNDAFNAML